MTAFRCGQGTVYATSDQNGQVWVKHRGRSTLFEGAGTVTTRCYCCHELYAVVMHPEQPYHLQPGQVTTWDLPTEKPTRTGDTYRFRN